MSPSFGQQLRQARLKRGQTAEQLSKGARVSRSYITLMENGRRLPGKKQLPKIAAALGLATGTVLNWYLEELTQKIHRAIKR